ncbi:MAG: ATP-binding cassette domain-containing protein [Planctomycetota bacterium]
MTGIGGLWRLLTARQRRRATWLGMCLVLAMVLEMIGVGIVVPILAVVATGLGADAPPALARWVEPFARLAGTPAPAALVCWGIGAVVGFWMLRTGYLVWVARVQTAFVADVQESLSRRLFASHLARPWASHLSANSADLVRSIGEIDKLATACTALLSAVAEVLVLVGVVGLLVWFEPVGAVAVGLLTAACTWLLVVLSRPHLFDAGDRVQAFTSAGVRKLQQASAGMKEILLLRCAPALEAEYATAAAGLANARRDQAFLVQIPRLWYELAAVVALATLCAVLVAQGKPTEALLPALGLFAAAAFRTLPSINRIAIGLQTVAFLTPAIDSLRRELADEPATPAPQPSRRMAFRDAIRLESVSFRYPDSAASALDRIDLSIPHGSAIGLAGGSGAGKSTLVDLILGLLTPSTGRITVDGIDIASDLAGWQSLVGYVPQAIHLFDDTIRRNVAFGVPDRLIDDAAVARALRAARLDDFVAGLPQGRCTTVGEHGVRLSGGQRQRIGIARALYRDPEVLVLDEATSSLDTATEAEVMAAVNALHGVKTLLIVAHRLSTVAECDVVYRVESGRLLPAPRLADAI